VRIRYDTGVVLYCLLPITARVREVRESFDRPAVAGLQTESAFEQRSRCSRSLPLTHQLGQLRAAPRGDLGWCRRTLELATGAVHRVVRRVDPADCREVVGRAKLVG